jgi:hypothetical protein
VSENNRFCVTTMAVPDPSVPVDDGKTNKTEPALLPANATGAEGFNASVPVNLRRR